MSVPTNPINPIPSTLLPEILGFSPQLLLDDIINITQSAVADSVNGMEAFLRRWADERLDKAGGEWDSTQEVEQGLVQFQTLLEYHTDIAFDFFEAWSLRNIFAFPPDLPIVIPHQTGLDLAQPQEREEELVDEIAQLRRQIANQRNLHRFYTRAVHRSYAKRRRSAANLDRLMFLSAPTLEKLSPIPAMLSQLHSSLAALPPMDSAAIAALTQFQLTEPGKRQWETSHTGYLNWAVGQLLERAAEHGRWKRAAVGGMDAGVAAVGSADLRAALAATESLKALQQTPLPRETVASKHEEDMNDD
jgi:kinetochore protein Mis12/MTW1